MYYIQYHFKIRKKEEKNQSLSMIQTLSSLERIESVQLTCFSPLSNVQRGGPAAVPALCAASGWGICVSCGGSAQDGPGLPCG